MKTTKNEWQHDHPCFFICIVLIQDVFCLFVKQCAFSDFLTTISNYLSLPSLFTHSSNAILSLAFQCQYYVWEATVQEACPTCHSTTIPHLALMWLHFISNVMSRLLLLYVAKPSHYFCYFFPRNDHCGNTVVLLPLALQLFVSFRLLNNFLPCISIHSHVNPILNLQFSQILSDITLPS